MQGRGVARGAPSEPGPYSPLRLAGGKDAVAGPSGKGGTGVLERGKPDPKSPTWWPQPVPLKCLLLWGAGAGILLCPTLRLRGGSAGLSGCSRAGEAGEQGKGSGASWGVAVARGCPWDPPLLGQGLGVSREPWGAWGGDVEPSWDVGAQSSGDLAREEEVSHGVMWDPMRFLVG